MSSLSLWTRGVVQEQVAGHQDEFALLGQSQSSSISCGAHRRRLLDEDMLPSLERQLRELVVGRDRGRDHDRFQLVGSARSSSKSPVTRAFG